MCAIGGFQLRHSANFDAGKLLTEIQKHQHHRGPDANGIWFDNNKVIGLCHNRLAIVDLSRQGIQPMHVDDGRYTISFNGEIYNWKELRVTLKKKGCIFQTNTDTEVILHGYKQFGVSILQKIRGMYAFAIWDSKEEVLFCARDRVGKKPFVYSETDNGFFFSSEIPALLSVRKIAKINTSTSANGLANMLLHNLRHIPEPCTAYQGINKLRPGHALMVKKGKVIDMWRHWQPQPIITNTPYELREIIEEAVSIRSVADVPVGALLSGGVDSTAIVSLMQQKSNKPIHTYAFGADKNDEDIRRAKIVSNKLGTIHKEFYFHPEEQYENFKKIISVYGEPIMLLPLIHAYELSKGIYDDGIKVVLNGNGADELFYGYTGHLNTARVTKMMNAFGWMRNIAPNCNNYQLSLFLAKPGVRKSTMYNWKAKEIWPTVLNNHSMEYVENIVSSEMSQWSKVLPHKDFIDESNYLSLLIENSHSVTIASDLPGMMTSVEMRSPFLDQKVIESAMGIHFSKKVKGPKDGSQLKNILRLAVSDLVPAELLNAPKRGFGMGVQERDLLLGAWNHNVDKILEDFPETEVFDPEKIRKIWRNAQKTGVARWDVLAKLFSIGVWKSMQ